MKKSEVAEPGSLRVSEIVPVLCLRPVLLVGSWAIGGKCRA
jgi:hypothetical protein